MILCTMQTGPFDAIKADVLFSFFSKYSEILRMSSPNLILPQFTIEPFTTHESLNVRFSPCKFCKVALKAKFQKVTTCFQLLTSVI